MKGYLLDSNVCIGWMKNNPSIVRRVVQAGEGKIWICAPVKAELWFGVYNSQRVQENKDKLRLFFENIPSLPLDDVVAEKCGELRAYLKRHGTPIGPYDLQIAALAMAHDLIVVTHNISEFSRVPGLVIEDWQDG